MKIDDLTNLARARLVYLSQLLASHTALGDVEAMARVQAEISDTQATLDQLNSL